MYLLSSQGNTSGHLPKYINIMYLLSPQGTLVVIFQSTLTMYLLSPQGTLVVIVQSTLTVYLLSSQGTLVVII